MNLKPKHRELGRHMLKHVDRHRWPDYQLTDPDLQAFVEHESYGVGDVPEPLRWAKQCEEITLQQMWHEMADHWSSGAGWWAVWRDNLSHAWAERHGTNVGVRKILAQARLIRRKGDFLQALLECTAFTADDRSRYLRRRFGDAL